MLLCCAVEGQLSIIEFVFAITLFGMIGGVCNRLEEFYLPSHFLGHLFSQKFATSNWHKNYKYLCNIKVDYT